MSRHVIIEGNLTRDPNGGYGKDSGKAYTHLDVAVTDRIKNANGEWIDGPPTYYRVTVFGHTAENALNSWPDLWRRSEAIPIWHGRPERLRIPPCCYLARGAKSP
jgi:hypothetical protein